MTSPFWTLEPSLTLSCASRPGILAETAAFVRATTYPFATTTTLPLPFAAPSPPEFAATTTVCTGIAAPRRPMITTVAMISTAAAVSHKTRLSARLTAGGADHRDGRDHGAAR